MRRLFAACSLVLLFVLLAVPSAPAATMGKPRVAALQIGLAHKGVYRGTIDGVWGDGTESAVRRLQRSARIPVDGVPGPQTRRALGGLGRHEYASRLLRDGLVGWDVSMTQFMLAWHGFPSGAMDGHFGARTTAAVRRFQVFARLGADGFVGPATFAALRRPLVQPAIRLTRPVPGGFTDGFGPRGNRFHAGLDFPAPRGARVRAAAAGVVARIGVDPSGYGRYVVVRHGRTASTWYAHLSATAVAVGQRVARGARIGSVGSSGSATGPHVHLELRVRGAAVDPARVL